MRLIFLKFFLIIFLITGCANTQSLYIRKASLYQQQESGEHVVENNSDAFNEYIKFKEKCKNLLLGGHYIIEGENLLILIRKWYRGSLFAIDDEYYEKLTIEVKDIELNKPMDIRDNNVRLFYSKGGSAWIGHCAGSFSNEGRGTVTIVESTDNNKLEAILDIKLVPKSADKKEELKEIHLTESFNLNKISISELTPWLGQKNPPPYTGGYPE